MNGEDQLGQELAQLAKAGSPEAQALIAEVVQTLDRYGTRTTIKTLKLAPIAQAKGESDAEIDLAIDRWGRGLTANIWVSLRPQDRRFPVEIRGTGSVNPFGSAIGLGTQMAS